MTGIDAYFKYNADFGPVINQMRLLQTQANLLNQTLQNFDKQASALKMSLGDSLASDIGKMGGWNSKVVELTDSVSTFGKALEKQELSLKQYAKEGIGALTKGSNAHKLAVREVAREMSQLAILGEKNGKQMGMMITPQNINLNDFNTKLAVSRKQFDIFNTIVQDGATKLINFGKNTQWAGRQITVGLTVPLASWGAQMSKVFREVNVELTRFQKVYGSGLMSSGDSETIKMTENVKQLGIEFAKTMGIAVKDTASLAADLAATGLEGQKLLNSIRETTRLATLGDVDRADAMKATLSIQNAFKVSTDELSHSVDFLNAVENQTSLSLQDLTTAIPKAGPVVKALGGDVKDLSLLMVALKEGGISAAEGANAIKSGMASLINPTKRASEVAAQYGIDVNKIVQSNRGQLMPTIIEFQKQLSLLDDFGKAQVIENIFGKYQFARISALFDNLNASSSQTMQVMELMGKSQRDLAANSYLEMDTLMNSGAKRFQRATESIKAQFIDIGGSITAAITPIIESVSKKIGQVIKFFDKLPAPIKSFIKVATGLAVIAGPIIMIAGVFSNFIGYLTKGAMGILNLGRRMSGIPVERFKMLDDTQLMARKSTDALSMAFEQQQTSVEKLNAVLAVYKKHLGDAITLNPGFVNQQVAAQTTTGKPPVAKFQTGGSAWVPGSGDGDKVPAMLEPGEYVVNKKAASKHSGLLDDINFNKAPRFQSGGRINGYAGGFFGDAKFGPDDLQNALKSWISPMMTGLRPFNNPTKTGGIQPYGERYPGFFADIFNQSMTPQENQHFMRAMQFDRKGGNMSPVAGTIMDAIIRAQQGKQSSPSLSYSNAPYSHETTRFTSFSTVQEAEFYKRFMTMFEKPKNKRSAESRARKTESGEIFPYLLDLWTGKGNGINGIPVSDLFQGQTQYGNEGEVVLPGGIKMPITGYGSDIKSRMLMLHSVMPGATKTINGKEVPIFQSGGRVNNYADKSISPELLSLVGTWQQSTQYLREDPERLQKFMSYFQPSSSAMTLRRKTSLGLPGEIPNEQQLEILKALESGDFLSLAGKKIGLNGSPQSYSEHPLDWLVGKQFSNPLSGREFIQEDLIQQQKRLDAFNFIADMYNKNPNNTAVIEELQKRLGLSPTTLLNQDAINLGRRRLEENIQGIKNKLQSQLPMGVEPKTVMIERLFGSGTSMLPISQIAQSTEYMGERLQEREIATSSTSGILDSVSQMWAPPSSFRGGQKAYDKQKHLFPYVLNMKQMGGRIQSAEAGWTPEETKKAYSQYTDTELQSHNFKGFGRGRSEKRRPYPDNEIWASNPLNTAFHVLLPNAVGRSEEEKTQLNILRRYMSMFNITDPNQLSPGMQASLMEMFMVHGGSPEIGVDPSRIVPMGEYDTGSAQMEGPGTYFSSNLKTQDEVWDEYAHTYKYTISKTREAFRKVARGKGYIEAYDEKGDFHEPSKQLRQLVNSFSRTKSGKEAMQDRDDYGPSFNKNHWLRDAQSAAEHSGPGAPFFEYLVKEGYQGIKWSPATITNFNIGREGISLSPISNKAVNSIYDEDSGDYIDLKQPLPARIPDLSPVGYQLGGRIQSAEGGMPQKYADKQAAIEQMLALAHLEATTGRFAGMPMTDIGQRQSGMGGFSSAIPGVNGVYEINGQKFIVKGHDTLDSALIESRGTQLTRDMFGLTTPEQELIKLAHPQTGQQMFGVRSPFDSRFARTSGQIAPDAFFKQALAAIIRGDADLQADNLFDSIVTDVGAGYVTDRASQPRTLSGKKNDVETQARINFLMQKGGARRWFAEATAGIAGSMTPEQYEAGFLNAIAEAQANAGGAIGALQNLTPEEKAMYELLQGDLSAASKIDWKAIHAHHIGIKPEPVKPKSAPTEKALQKKAADAAERQQALDAGFPSWMQSGGMVSSAAGGYQFAHIVPPDSLGNQIAKTYPIGLDVPGHLNSQLNSSFANKKELISGFSQPEAIAEMSKSFNSFNKKFPESALSLNVPKEIQLATVNTLSDAPSKINDEELYKQTKQEKIIMDTLKVFKKSQYLRDVRANISEDLLMKNNFTIDENGYYVSPDGTLTLEKVKEGGRTKWKDVLTGKTVGSSATTDRRRTFPSNNPLLSILTQSKQSGGRVNNFADDSMVTATHIWDKKSSAPKQYEGILRGLPDWATKGAEAQAILAALRSAGVDDADKKAKYYIQDVLAHINPATTNDGEIYTKIWEAANLMKDSQVYNTFLETVQSRKDIQSRGGLVAPHVVQGVMADSKLPQGVVIEELTKLSQGKHPTTRQGAMVMLALARMFPQTAKAGRGIPIGVIAGMQERLKGDFYETLQSRALPAGLPTVKVTSVNDENKTPQSRSGAVLPGTPNMPKIVYPSMAGGGDRISGTGATVNVSPDGKILSSTIDDMLVTSASGQPMAVSSRELLAVTPEGTVAGVTSPGDEARKRIIHPFGTSLIRGKNFRAKSAADGDGFTEPVYMEKINPGSMNKFASVMSLMATSGFQMKFILDQFTSDVQNGRQKWVAGMMAATKGLQIFADNGMGSFGRTLKKKGIELQKEGRDSDSTLSTLKGKAAFGIGSGMSKLSSALSNPLVSMGIDLAITGIQKGIEIYNAEMEKARQAGKAAFAAPLETAKLLGIQLKSTTDAVEKFNKVAQNISGLDQGIGAYNKAFEKTVKTDFSPLIDTLKNTKSLQEKNNQLVTVYSNLIQRGVKAKEAREITAEIARQGEALDSYASVVERLKTIKTAPDALAQQILTLKNQTALLQQKSNQFGVKAQWSGQNWDQLTKSRAENEKVMFEALGATGNGLKDKFLRGIFGTRGVGVLGIGALFTSLIAPVLIDNKVKTQIASQLGATLKSAFAMAAEAPTASVEAVNLITSQFKNADIGKLADELQTMVKDAGFGEGSAIFDFFGKDGGFFKLDKQKQNAALLALGNGMGQDLSAAILNGTINADLGKKIPEELAKRMSLVKIETDVDLQLEDSAKQLDKLKAGVQKVFDVAIQAKQAELGLEDKRHEKALENLDLESEKINKKKELLQENTDYYLKQLQKEKEAEDFYAKQRQTGLSGLKAIASGDVFGFIGSQIEAASNADQYGRDLSLQNIQNTADAEQKKLDDALKGVDDRKKAEDDRHQNEIDNINNEIELLRKKESEATGQINQALDLIEKAKGMAVGSAGWNKAVTSAQTAANKAEKTATSAGTGLTINTGDKDIIKSFKNAKSDFNDAVAIMAGDTLDAVDRLNAASINVKKIFKSQGIDPATSQAYQDVFSLLQKPPAPGVTEAVAAFAYAITLNENGLPGITNTPTNPPSSAKSGYAKDGRRIYEVDGKWQYADGTPYSGKALKTDPQTTPVTQWKYYADGGYISGAGNSTSDSIPARLSNGEYVVKASSVDKYGKNFLDSINGGSYIPGFAFGGLVKRLWNGARNTVSGISDTVNNIAISAIRNPKQFITSAASNVWSGAKRVGGFVADNFLGVDDFRSMYNHFKKGEFKAGFKSLGGGLLELGTTALMFVPGAGQAAMLAKFAQVSKIANIASKASKVMGLLSKGADAKNAVYASGTLVDLIGDVGKLKSLSESNKLKVLLESNKTKRLLNVARPVAKASEKYVPKAAETLDTFDSAQSLFNIATGKGEGEDYKNVANYGGNKITHRLFPWFKYAASGGHMTGPGTSTSDSIPAMLSNGEYVVKASSVAKYGTPFMDAINAGRYAGGGGVGVMPKTSVPSSPRYSVPSTPSMSPSNIASIAQYNGGGYAEGNTNSPSYNFNFNGAGMDMVMGHVNKAMGGTIGNNSRGVYC